MSRRHHCVCKPEPKPPVYGRLKADTPISDVYPNYAYTKLIIPKGTRCRQIPDGSSRGACWVDDLSWIDRKMYGMLLHDATHYGITLKPERVELCRDTQPVR